MDRHLDAIKSASYTKNISIVDGYVFCVDQIRNGNYVSSDDYGIIKIWDKRTN